jgi:hypothetical protein
MKIDASKERGFAIYLFYLKKGYVILDDLSKIALTAMEPILFLSKLLSPAERNYSSTEIEVVYLLYACRRLRIIL